MAYSDFTLDRALRELSLTGTVAPLFPSLAPIDVPSWLREQLDRNLRQPLVSEKARNELIVMPVLIAVHEAAASEISIYSGQAMNVDAGKGLVGECDFILARTPPLPALQAP